MSKVYCKDCRYLRGNYSWSGGEMPLRYRSGFMCSHDSARVVTDEPIAPCVEWIPHTERNKNNNCADFEYEPWYYERENPPTRLKRFLRRVCGKPEIKR